MFVVKGCHNYPESSIASMGVQSEKKIKFKSSDLNGLYMTVLSFNVNNLLCFILLN